MMIRLSLIILLTTRSSEPIQLRAGPLSMVFEPDNALLLYIGCRHHMSGLSSRWLAMTEISFSNSLIEAWWRALKHQWLYLNSLDTLSSL